MPGTDLLKMTHVFSSAKTSCRLHYSNNTFAEVWYMIIALDPSVLRVCMLSETQELHKSLES